MHLLLTSASWQSMVGHFFPDIAQGSIKRDSFTSVGEVELAIALCIADQ